MAAFRANSYSRYSNDDEDTCISCFATTKYNCLHCEMSICNKCSVFEDNEEAPGWTAGKSVGHCEACIKELGGKQKSSIAEKLKDNFCSVDRLLREFCSIFIRKICLRLGAIFIARNMGQEGGRACALRP